MTLNELIGQLEHIKRVHNGDLVVIGSEERNGNYGQIVVDLEDAIETKTGATVLAVVINVKA